jgi:hypothetical protein
MLRLQQKFLRQVAALRVAYNARSPPPVWSVGRLPEIGECPDQGREREDADKTPKGQREVQMRLLVCGGRNYDGTEEV